jgi:hypothetical protein
MARKSAIGANSHDAAVRTRTGGTKRAEPAKAVKERVTFQLPVGLIEQARDVVSSRQVSPWRASWNRRSLLS